MYVENKTSLELNLNIYNDARVILLIKNNLFLNSSIISYSCLKNNIVI